MKKGPLDKPGRLKASIDWLLLPKGYFRKLESQIRMVRLTSRRINNLVPDNFPIAIRVLPLRGIIVLM